MNFLKTLPKEKLQKLILVVLGSLIALGAVINFYLLRNVEELSTTTRLTTELKAKIESSAAEVKNEVSNAVVRDKMKTFVEAQQQRMVTGDPFSWVVREISLLAEKHPVHVLGLSPGGKTAYAAKPPYSWFSARLDVTGTYDQLGRFVCDLENSFPTGHIHTLNVSDASSGKGTCRADIDLMLLMRPEETAKSATKTGAEPKKRT